MKLGAAMFLGFVLGVLLARTPKPPAPIYVPCAVPVYARQAVTLEELEQQAAMRRLAMERCGQKMTEARRER
jgi:hypothetical protein